MIEIAESFVGAGGVGELIHRPNDFGHLPGAFEGLVDGPGNLIGEVVDVGSGEALFQVVAAPVESVPRRHSPWTRAATVTIRPITDQDSRRKTMLSLTYWIGVLISCAMPAASWPMTSNFCIWRICSCKSFPAPWRLPAE